MNKLKFIAVLCLLSAALACKSPSNTANAPLMPGGKTTNRPIANLPKDIKSAAAKPDADTAEAIVVSILPGSKFYVGNKEVVQNTLTYEVKTLQKNILAPVFINADYSASYEDILKTLEALRKSNDVRAVELLVQSADGKTSALKAWLPIEITPDMVAAETDAPPPPDGYGKSDKEKEQMLVNLGKDGKITLNAETVTAEQLTEKLAARFKNNEAKKIYREGTQETYKTVTLRTLRSSKYADVVKLLDQLTAAGAMPLYLQLDDLSD